MFGLFKKKPKEPFYKFDIDQEVSIHAGWEKPIGKGVVENRSYGYHKNYAGILVPYPIYLVDGKEYHNRDLTVL